VVGQDLGSDERFGVGSYGIGNNGGSNDERRFLQFAGKMNF